MFFRDESRRYVDNRNETHLRDSGGAGISEGAEYFRSTRNGRSSPRNGLSTRGSLAAG